MCSFLKDLPDEIINKINTYNSHPVADLFKKSLYFRALQRYRDLVNNNDKITVDDIDKIPFLQGMYHARCNLPIIIIECVDAMDKFGKKTPENVEYLLGYYIHIFQRKTEEDYIYIVPSAKKRKTMRKQIEKLIY
jgi:hypothetical protein